MKKCKVILLVVLIMFLFDIGEVLAVGVTDSMFVHMSVDSIAVLNVNPGSDITLTVSAPATAVAAFATKKITAQLSAAVLSGCSLKLQATVGSGSNEGTSAGQVTLSNESATNIVTGIGTCATGTTSTDGTKLTYTLTVDTMGSLVAAQEKHLSVTFTLTDAS
jgi:hypothetical protein